MEEIARTAAEATGGMSVGTFLAIIAALVTVITALGEVIKAQVQKRTNPLNGTLARLDSTLREVNTAMTQVGVRSEDSSRVLARHTEKLVTMGVAVTQLAANEAEQTRALLALQPAIETSLTGCASRITDHCKDRSNAILSELDKAGQRS